MNIFDRIKQNFFGIPLDTRGFNYDLHGWIECRFCKSHRIIVHGRNWQCENCGSYGYDAHENNNTAEPWR